jgi:CBS domain-containing protein
MSQVINLIESPRLALDADTAGDLMVPNPVAVRATATAREAAELLAGRRVTAAPVIDEAGRPVGVVSRYDLLGSDPGRDLPVVPEYYTHSDPVGPSAERLRRLPAGPADRTRVEEVMTPVVFAVCDFCLTREVVEEMKRLWVHRLFVVDREGTLVGVISLFDVLNKLHP